MRAYFVAGLKGCYFWAGGVDDSRAVGGGDYGVREGEGVEALFLIRLSLGHGMGM